MILSSSFHIACTVFQAHLTRNSFDGLLVLAKIPVVHFAPKNKDAICNADKVIATQR